VKSAVAGRIAARIAGRLLPAILALLAAGCVAKAAPSVSASSSPTDSQPPVITMSALPNDGDGADGDSGIDSAGGTDSTDGLSDTANPSDPIRPSTPSPVSSTAPVSTVAPAGGLADCALPYLRITVRPAGARSSHASYLLSFTNTGQIACQLTGYPAVTVLSSSGQPVLRATATPNGYLGGVRSRPATVLIASGQPGSALLEGELIDINGNRCPRRPGLAITPPDGTLPARIPVATAICGGVQVHPVVVGSTASTR
jgi:Protein of unknown function (DUF4232)